MRNAILSAAVGIGLAPFLLGCGENPLPALGFEPLDAQVQRTSWDGQGPRGSRLQTANYAIYTTGRGGDLLPLLPAYMEASYRNYHRLTGLAPRPSAKPMAIYILGTREEWASLTRSLMGPSADTYLQIQSGGYCHGDVCVFWQLGGLAMFEVAAHEGLHQFLHRRLADQLPMWLEEGLCTQAEAFELQGDRVSFDPARNLSRRGDLEGALIRGFWIPTEDLLPMDAGDAVTGSERQAVGYYGQLWALVRFLRSDPTYSAGLDRLLADAEAGRFHEAIGLTPQAMAELRAHGRGYNKAVSEKLFRHYVAGDVPAFEKRYKDFCYRLVGMK